MTPFLLSQDNLVLLLEELSQNLEVIAPVLAEGEPVFATWKGQPLALDKENPLNSPAEFFLPQRETLFRYVQYSGRYTFEEDPPKSRLILGMRPCDVQAIRVLDQIFGSGPADLPYVNKRKSTIIVALNCTKPQETCFCAQMGAGPRSEVGYDLLFTEIEQGYVVESGTPAGMFILKYYSHLFEEALPEHLEEMETRLRDAENAVRKNRPDMSAESILQAAENVDLDRAEKECLQCGGCSLVCPICHCFSTMDQGVPDGERIRCRDSCVLAGFSRMTGGANPRETLGKRQLHWYLDKFVYIPEKTGMLGCVGCGRCSKVCLGKVDRWKLLEEAMRR